MRIVQDDVNACCLRKLGQDPVGFVLRIVEGLLQVGDPDAFSLDCAFSAACFPLVAGAVHGFLCLCFCVGSSLTGLIRILALRLCEIGNASHALYRAHRYAGFSHVVCGAVRIVVLLHVLTGLIGVEKGTCLRTVLHGRSLDGAAIIVGGNILGCGCFSNRCCANCGRSFRIAVLISCLCGGFLFCILHGLTLGHSLRLLRVFCRGSINGLLMRRIALRLVICLLQQSAVFLRVNAACAKRLGPRSVVLSAVDILRIQFIGNTLTVLAL